MMEENEKIEMKEVKNIPPHLQRVLEERESLNEKIVKLEAFINNGNENFAKLSLDEKQLLEAQVYYMGLYLKTLDKRLKLASLSKE